MIPSDFDLISGRDIEASGGFHVRQPTLKDIKDPACGYEKYIQYLSMLMIDKNSISKLLDLDKMKPIFGQDILDKITLLDLLTVSPATGEPLAAALSFFMREHIVFDELDCSLVVRENHGRALTADNYNDIRFIVLKCAYVQCDDAVPVKFASEKAKHIYEKIMAGRAKHKHTASDAKLELPNLISSIAASGNGYDLINIWNLTVYQIYDQFARINVGVELSIYGQRWAAWGKDQFDTSMWYTNLNKEK